MLFGKTERVSQTTTGPTTGRPVSSWTCDEVASFIGTLDVAGKGEEYKLKFLEERIDGASLQSLSIEHYKLMGIPLGHAMNIMKKISELQPESNVQPVLKSVQPASSQALVTSDLVLKGSNSD
jgi:hypothetical protein